MGASAHSVAVNDNVNVNVNVDAEEVDVSRRVADERGLGGP